jgi:hypothetical protein
VPSDNALEAFPEGRRRFNCDLSKATDNEGESSSAATVLFTVQVVSEEDLRSTAPMHASVTALHTNPDFMNLTALRDTVLDKIVLGLAGG